MLTLIVERYWRLIATVLSICIFIAYIIYLKNEISSVKKDNAELQSKLNEANTYLNTQNSAILANQADYNASMEKLPQELHKIDTKYVTKTIEVIKWRDRNDTENDCNSSINYLNNYQF